MKFKRDKKLEGRIKEVKNWMKKADDERQIREQRIALDSYKQGLRVRNEKRRERRT